MLSVNTRHFAPLNGIVISKDVRLRTRDGIHLATDLYRPARDGEPLAGPFPTILCRTPYNKGDQRNGAQATRHMMVRDPACYSFAPTTAVFEPRHVAGDVVEAGQCAGFFHFVEDLDHAPIELRYAASGVLWMAAGPGRVQRGDCVAVVMQDYEAPKD